MSHDCARSDEAGRARIKIFAVGRCPIACAADTLAHRGGHEIVATRGEAEVQGDLAMRYVIISAVVGVAMLGGQVQGYGPKDESELRGGNVDAGTHHAQHDSALRGGVAWAGCDWGRNGSERDCSTSA
jgi:hypothetical protein